MNGAVSLQRPQQRPFYRESMTGAVAKEIKVIVSDDSAHIRRRLVRMLGRLPQVQIAGEAEDVPSTIERVETIVPDVVVLDINMPGGSGIDALKHIKREHPEVEVIMLTNHANPFYKEACYQAGASHFFDKSTEFQRVPEVLRAMTNNDT